MACMARNHRNLTTVLFFICTSTPTRMSERPDQICKSESRASCIPSRILSYTNLELYVCLRMDLNQTITLLNVVIVQLVKSREEQQ